MIKISYDSHSTLNKAWLDNFEQKMVTYAVATSINTIAVGAQKRIVGLMRDVFDRPTPYTLKSTYVKFVKSAKVMAGEAAEVGLKDSGQTPASNFLTPGIMGGDRRQKRSEKLFAFQGIIRGNQMVAPGSGARMDAYGNVSRGQMQQVLSAVQAQGDVYSNSSKTSARASTRRNANRYFAGRPRGSGSRSFAIYERAGRRLRVVFNVIEPPRYSKRLPFEETVHDEYNKKFDRLFETYLTFAIGGR